MSAPYAAGSGLCSAGGFPVGNLIHTESSDDLEDQWEDSLPLAELRVDHPYLGSPMDVFRENALAIPPHIWSNLHDPESSLAIFSMFLLGLFVGRTRILYDVAPHLPLIRRVFGWGIGIGAASALAEWWLSQKFGYAVFTETTASNAGPVSWRHALCIWLNGAGAGLWRGYRLTGAKAGLANRSPALREPGENGPDGLSVQYGDVHHAVLRMGFWSAFPVGAGRHHLFMPSSFLCDTADFLHLVVGQIQVWAS